MTKLLMEDNLELLQGRFFLSLYPRLLTSATLFIHSESDESESDESDVDVSFSSSTSSSSSDSIFRFLFFTHLDVFSPLSFLFPSNGCCLLDVWEVLVVVCFFLLLLDFDWLASVVFFEEGLREGETLA